MMITYLLLTIVFTYRLPPPTFLFFFFNDTATTEIYTLSLHDALPIHDALGREHPRQQPHADRSRNRARGVERGGGRSLQSLLHAGRAVRDRDRRAAAAARFPRRAHHGAGAVAAGRVQGRRPHGVHGRRTLRGRDVRVLGSAREGRPGDPDGPGLPDARPRGIGQRRDAAGHPRPGGWAGLIRRGHEGERRLSRGPGQIGRAHV